MGIMGSPGKKTQIRKLNDSNTYNSKISTSGLVEFRVAWLRSNETN